MRGLQRPFSGRPPDVAGYILFAIAAVVAVFMLGYWGNQRLKGRGKQKGRRY
jgi:hypothetical protein